MRVAMLTGVAACLLAGCTSEADKVEKVAEWLCRYGQLEELQPMGLPDDQQLSEYVRAEDVAFLETQRTDDGKAAGAFGGLAQAMEAAMKPAARAIAQARAAHSECEVSVDVQGNTATAQVEQTVPKLDQGNPVERLQELAELDGHDARVARASQWFDEATESEAHAHTVQFIKTSEGSRADLQLPERERARQREEPPGPVDRRGLQLRDPGRPGARRGGSMGTRAEHHQRWARVDAPEEAVLEVEVVRIDGSNGNPLFSVMDVDQGTAEELQSLRRELAELTD